MLVIRLQRTGRRNRPSYRAVVIEKTAAAKKGKPVEILGNHDSILKKTELKGDRIKYWISQGAQVSDTMHNLLVKNGIIEGKMKNVLPKKKVIVSEQPEKTKEESPSVENEKETKTEEKPTEAEKETKTEENPTEAEKENSSNEKTPTPSSEG